MDHMEKRNLPPGATALATVLLSLCPEWSSAADHRVAAETNDFIPAQVEVAPGDTVTWVGNSPVLHQMRFDADPTGGGAAPELFVRNRPVSLRVTVPGSYHYVCTWHGMHGHIIVRQPSTNTP